MLKQLIRAKDIPRINCYGATTLVEKISKLSLGETFQASKSLSTASRDAKESASIERFLRIDPPTLIPFPRPIKEIRDVPRIRLNIIEPPRERLLTEINSIVRQEKEIKLPEAGIAGEKLAARLIVIRRKKMKKHKLRKLRKKMKYVWAKVKQRREMRKEKAFRAEIFAQIKEAENFSAEKYVEEKIRKATETPIPRFWKNRRLPQFIIKQKLGIK